MDTHRLQRSEPPRLDASQWVGARTLLRWSGLVLVVLLSAACKRQATTSTCGAALPADAWSKGLLILGELHGTEQAPARVLATACDAAKREGAVWIGLELPNSEQGALNAFLEGGSKDALLRAPLWTRSIQDGRTSRAMLALLEGVRSLRQQGLKLDVIAFDVAPAEGYAKRDLRMAEQIQAARNARPGSPGIVLVGAGHATRRLALPKPMAWHLEAAGIPFLSLQIAHRGGSAWLSGTTAGGVDPQAPRGPAPDAFSEGMSTESPEAGFDGWWDAGAITASPPAVGNRD